MSDHPSCIDISHWQGFPDFEKVAASGVVACIMKASEGTSYVDPNCTTNYLNATRAGIACCTYHWLSPGNAAEQMRFYLSVVDPVQGERMVIDYEEDGCTLDDLHEAVAALMADPRQLQVTVYSGHLLKEQLVDKRDDFLSDNTDLWLAQYTSGTPSWPAATYSTWTLWQYSESGSVDGIDGGAVDLNRFNGTDENLVKWISPASRRPAPDVEVETVIGVALTVSPNARIELSINGVPVEISEERSDP
jgi:lysozyme